jgi:hypothetical protein
VSNTQTYAGRIHIYSAPAALTQHIEWAINQHLNQVVKITWVNQSLSPGCLASELEYKSKLPVAAKIATALKSWHYIRCEIRQIDLRSSDATLYRITPDLGLHQASLASNGDVVINENQLNQIINNSYSHKMLQSNLENALGSNWEIELEPYRIALASGTLGSISKSG